MSKVAMAKFDHKSYIDKKKLADSDDPYKSNKFNQKASDSMALDRPVPDVRLPG